MAESVGEVTPGDLLANTDSLLWVCADLARDARDLGGAFCSAFFAKESFCSLERVVVVSVEVGLAASGSMVVCKHISQE